MVHLLYHVLQFSNYIFQGDFLVHVTHYALTTPVVQLYSFQQKHYIVLTPSPYRA
jgi:hypothetical protein